MTLNELALKILEQLEKGHGDKQVFYRHSSSGDCGNVNSLYVTDSVSDEGPFDLEEGTEYVAISIGGN